MRKFVMAVGMLGAISVAVNGMAELPKPGAPATRPPSASPPVGTVPLNLAPTVHIVGFNRGGGGTYAGGPVSLYVDVENTGTTSAAVQVKLATSDLAVSEQSVDIGAKTTKQLVFVDKQGGSACGWHPYSLKVIGAAADGRDRHAKITPTCTFSTKVVDPWNLAEPDRVDDAQKNKVYVTNVSVETAPTCTAALKLKGQVTNHASKAGTSLILNTQAGNDTVGHSIAFALPVGAAKQVEAVSTDVGSPWGTAEVKLFDPTNNLTSNIVNQGITVTTTHACTLAATLEP